jgi:DNA-binding MarR family transcriptional regulator
MELSRNVRDGVGDDPETSASSPDAYLVPYLLSRAAGGFNRAWLEQLRHHGVTIARWQVLAILAEYDGARLGQLAQMSGAEQSVTSRIVDQMERDGLVERRPAPDDGRVVEVWTTDAGRDLTTALLPEATDLVRTALAGLDDRSIAVLMDALTTVIGNLGGVLAPVDPEPARKQA